MEAIELSQLLESLDRSKDSEWMHSLPVRKKEEAEFHDQRLDRQVLDRSDLTEKNANLKYYDHTGPSQAYYEEWIRKNAPGKVFLDYACGDGRGAIIAAEAGAKLAIGIDISGVSIDTARKKAERAGVGKTTVFITGDCENTGLPAESIDVVLCCGMLHHLDLSYAFPELRRIMKVGGRIMAYEALNYNPFISLYRRLTPEFRTNWEKEHILNLNDVKFSERFFTLGEMRFWHVTSILSPHLRFLSPVFHAIDSVVTKIPVLQLMAWIFTFELVKTERS